MTASKIAICEFWSWLASNVDALGAMRDSSDPFWESILNRLQEIDRGLRFELSEPIDGVQEFIVTAAGDRRLFPLVDLLMESAPTLERWRFIALKPPMGFDFVITYEGAPFDPKTMWFLPLRSASDHALLGLRIGIPRLSRLAHKKACSAILIILDTALGERAAAEAFQHTEVVALPTHPEREGFIELRELPAYLAWQQRDGKST